MSRPSTAHSTTPIVRFYFSSVLLSSSRQSSSSDPYHGHEHIAKLCARFVSHLFACLNIPPPPSGPLTPRLEHFIAYVLHHTRLHTSVTFAALYLLQRLKAHFPAAKDSSGHRLFISAFIIASKVICDDTYSNKSWCIVGQGMFDPSVLLISFFFFFSLLCSEPLLRLCSFFADTYSNKSWCIVGQGTFALREISQKEWQLSVDPSLLHDLELQVCRDFAGPGCLCPSSAGPTPW